MKAMMSAEPISSDDIRSIVGLMRIKNEVDPCVVEWLIDHLEPSTAGAARLIFRSKVGSPTVGRDEWERRDLAMPWLGMAVAEEVTRVEKLEAAYFKFSSDNPDNKNGYSRSTVRNAYLNYLQREAWLKTLRDSQT
ncbi:hypothetical protein [Pseudomonas sp.]|uniref:hypothetical protein n=1 Tax=Pseudomonas sp. TaxID=306 RepID=UPI002605870C|nr:hypothetical protein [Pseudomonas sp.]